MKKTSFHESKGFCTDMEKVCLPPRPISVFFKNFRTIPVTKLSILRYNINCQSQPQLQLSLWPRIALIFISPHTNPPPTRPTIATTARTERRMTTKSNSKGLY